MVTHFLDAAFVRTRPVLAGQISSCNILSCALWPWSWFKVMTYPGFYEILLWCKVGVICYSPDKNLYYVWTVNLTFEIKKKNTFVHYFSPQQVILYRYFIALREIYQNVCSEIPRNPKGRGKYNISGIPGSGGTNIQVYFERNKEITVM